MISFRIKREFNFSSSTLVEARKMIDAKLEAPKVKKMKVETQDNEKRIKKPNITVHIPNSNFNDCDCLLNKHRCTCGYMDFIKRYEKRIERNLNDQLYYIELKHGSSNVRDILNYRYPGEYEGVIIDYYYENEMKPRHLRKKNISPFDLLSNRKLDMIINRIRKCI